MPFINSVRGTYGAQSSTKNKIQALGGTDSTGGTITTAGGYRIHTFTAVGTSTFTASGSGNVEILMVGGGGAAGYYAGGGGAGEVLFISRAIISGAHSLTIGAGGIGSSGTYSTAMNGNQTTGFGETAKPGGGARSSDDRDNPISGTGVYSVVANGGGGSSRSGGYFGSLGTSVGLGVTRYGGNRGGNDSNADNNSFNQGPNYTGGGGGGAGASVTGNSGGVNGTAGGIGVASSITGTLYYYGGGGGGGTYYQGTGGNGGNGGGGAGSGGGGGGTGGAGINAGGNGGTGAGGYAGANTGGGGGAGRGETSSRGGDGGSGIIVVRYPI
jgi:hypothetical protein